MGAFSFAISIWSPAHGILTIFTINGNVSNLQREIPCLPSAYNLRFPHRIYPVDKSTLYSRSVNCMCSWTLWVLAGLVITPPLPSPNANLAARQNKTSKQFHHNNRGVGAWQDSDSMQDSSRDVICNFKFRWTIFIMRDFPKLSCEIKIIVVGKTTLFIQSSHNSQLLSSQLSSC